MFKIGDKVIFISQQYYKKTAIVVNFKIDRYLNGNPIYYYEVNVDGEIKNVPQFWLREFSEYEDFVQPKPFNIIGVGGKVNFSTD